MDDDTFQQGKGHIAWGFIRWANAQAAGLQFELDIAAVEIKSGSTRVEKKRILGRKANAQRANPGARIQPQ
jgi:hypothetical protein